MSSHFRQNKSQLKSIEHAKPLFGIDVDFINCGRGPLEHLKWVDDFDAGIIGHDSEPGKLVGY